MKTTSASLKSNATVKCVVHGTRIPRAAAHEHHEAPRAAGGSDDQDNLIWLCATCHQLSHRIAQLRHLGRLAEAEDIIGVGYNPSQRKRLNQVVYEIMSALAHASAAGLGKEKAEVMLELEHELYAFLKGLASDRRDNGERVGVTKFMISVLHGHAIKNGYLPEGKQEKVLPKINSRLM